MAITIRTTNSAPEIKPIVRPVKSYYGRNHKRSKDGSDKKPKSGGMAGRRLLSKYKSKAYGDYDFMKH